CLPDDRDHERRRGDVLRCVDRLRQAALLPTGHDDELPPLAVLRAAGEPTRVEDPLADLVADRRVGVRALVAFRGDGEVRIHRRAPASVLQEGRDVEVTVPLTLRATLLLRWRRPCVAARAAAAAPEAGGDDGYPDLPVQPVVDGRTEDGVRVVGR